MSVITGEQGDALSGVIADPAGLETLRACLRRPVHAYLLVGSGGSGTAEAAVAFGAELLAQGADDPESARHRALAGIHPDLHVVERVGPYITVANAQEVTKLAATSPLEGEKKVIVLQDFHLVRDAGPALLKTIEEPAASTVFVILADFLPPELQTIASRCVRIDFGDLPAARVAEALEAEGVPPESAERIAALAGGRIDRARLLARDPELERRRQAWAEVPTTLDGSGATAARLVDQLLGLVDSSVTPLKAAQEEALEELTERNKRAAEVSGKVSKSSRSGLKTGIKELEERHARELRRQRTDEIRFGLSVMAGVYAERLGDPAHGSRGTAIDAIACLDSSARSLQYNPGETLLLQALFARLGSL